MTGIIGKIPSRSKIVESLATVEQGGTGASTLTDGGVLLGSGSGAVTATAVLANSEMLVGDGTTDPAIESGATLRTSIGIGTGDSPTFALPNLTGTLATGVQDNITRLGTVTTGTMNNTIGSSATFPAGHVIQVVSSGYLSAGTAGTGVSATGLERMLYPNGSTTYNKQITSIASGNKVFVICNFAFDIYGDPAGGNVRGRYGLGWNDGSSDVTLIASTVSDIMFQITGETRYEALYRQGLTLTYLHTPDVTAPIYFLEGASGATTNSARVGIGGVNFTLMEIQS